MFVKYKMQLEMVSYFRIPTIIFWKIQNWEQENFIGEELEEKGEEVEHRRILKQQNKIFVTLW